jgi:hypothetical protein
MVLLLPLLFAPLPPTAVATVVIMDYHHLSITVVLFTIVGLSGGLHGASSFVIWRLLQKKGGLD